MLYFPHILNTDVYLTYCFYFLSEAQVISLVSCGDVTFSHKLSRVLSRPLLGGAGLGGHQIARLLLKWQENRLDSSTKKRAMVPTAPAFQSCFTARPSSLYSTWWCADTTQTGQSTFPGAPGNSTQIAKWPQCCHQNTPGITAFSSLLPIPVEALFLPHFKCQIPKPGPPAHA